MMLIYFIFLSQNMDASAKFKTALNSVTQKLQFTQIHNTFFFFFTLRSDENLLGHVVKTT